MQPELFQDRVNLLLSWLNELRQTHESVDRRSKIRNFMTGTLDLYLARKENPSLGETPEFRRYLDESAAQLTWLGLDITHFISKTEKILEDTFYADEWITVCRNRSAIEALKELYQDTNFGEHFDSLDTEDLDDQIQNVGSREGYLSENKIPAGIPHSHWWWWYPETPGAS